MKFFLHYTSYIHNNKQIAALKALKVYVSYFPVNFDSFKVISEKFYLLNMCAIYW